MCRLPLCIPTREALCCCFAATPCNVRVLPLLPSRQQISHGTYTQRDADEWNISASCSSPAAYMYLCQTELSTCQPKAQLGYPELCAFRALGNQRSCLQAAILRLGCTAMAVGYQCEDLTCFATPQL
jgi:hypothetical protein